MYHYALPTLTLRFLFCVLFFFFLVFVAVVYFETGFLCVILDVLELTQ